MTEINKLAFSSGLKEYLDLGDLMYVGCKDGKLVAVEVYRLEELDGTLLPRFIHIILHPSIQRSKTAVEFLIKNERDVARYGYKKSWCFILKERCDMAKLAMKFGFSKLREDLNTITLVKNIERTGEYV